MLISNILINFEENHVDMMQDEFKHFDMSAKPVRQKNYLRPLTWILSFPDVWKNHTKINKINMEGLKPPYILLCNHNAFVDFKVTTAAIFPHRANYVVAIDGFIKREWLMRKVGCICKRKFTNDPYLIRHLNTVVKNGDIIVLFPEARYSLCGTNAILPESLGKLVKFLNVPVVTLIMNGHHIKTPFWNLNDRGNFSTSATITQLLTRDEIKEKNADEINHLINNKFIYDDFAWHANNKIKITYKDRAKGLHKVLYQCPNCKVEYNMHSDGTKIMCESCKKEWEMNEYGKLEAVGNVETEFSHIPDWYEWQRKQVRNEIDNGTYYFESPVRVDSLPNSKGYINLGEATLIHDMNGFHLKGEYNQVPYTVEKSVLSMYSCHIEYDYLGKFGDCVDLNTLNDTYYIYPHDSNFSVTKIALATEELYKANFTK